MRTVGDRLEGGQAVQWKTEVDACSRESQHTEEFTPGSGWATMENEKDPTLTAITSGSKYFSNVRSPDTSHTQTLSNPFRNLTNKVRGKIFYKEVFLRLLSCVRRLFRCLYHRASYLLLHRYVSSIYMYISAWISRWLYNIYIYIYIHTKKDNMTVQSPFLKLLSRDWQRQLCLNVWNFSEIQQIERWWKQENYQNSWISLY